MRFLENQLVTWHRSRVTSPFLHGISHNKLEDTSEEHIELAVIAFDKLAEKAMRWIERSDAR